MQVQKEEVRQKILSEARVEFSERGFLKANIRGIASRGGVSIGNIYNYFSGKDDVFSELVSPTVREIERILDEAENTDYLEEPEKWSYEYHMEFVESVAGFIDTHRYNLRLIAFHAHGSALENFRERVIERFSANMINFVRTVKSVYPDNGVIVSDFFIHNIASFYVNVIEEILMHDVLYEQMLSYLKEIMEFAFEGWKPLMNWYSFLPWKVD